MERTGVTNVILAGGLPIDEDSLASVPLAGRVLCKWSLHRDVEGGVVLDYEACLEKLMDAKRLASKDTRIDGYHVDDFSTGSIEAGAKTIFSERSAKTLALRYLGFILAPRMSGYVSVPKNTHERFEVNLKMLISSRMELPGCSRPAPRPPMPGPGPGRGIVELSS